MTIDVHRIREWNTADLAALCRATEDAIREGIGFNWISPPLPETLEAYWKGALVVPERQIYGGWLDGTLAASIQLVKPGKSKETSSFSARIEAHFVAPWARGHGLARALLHQAERDAAAEGFTALRLDVRETQDAAIHLYQENGYVRWGILPYYEFVGGHMVAGYFFYKKLELLSNIE
jgi:ribosomal protein S18 acetylase RimI-like enzyme